MKKEIWNESNISDQTDKVFIVTGPTSGLGKETSHSFLLVNMQQLLWLQEI